MPVKWHLVFTADFPMYWSYVTSSKCVTVHGVPVKGDWDIYPVGFL